MNMRATHLLDAARRHAVAHNANDAAGDTPVHRGMQRGRNIFWHKGQVETNCRENLFGHRPATVWLTGLSGAGKSTLAYELEKYLLLQRRACYVLDGDNLRHHLNCDLGFSADARRENIRRAAEVARLMNDAGLIVITAFISPFVEDRAMARAIVGDARFIEVHVCTALEVCEARDPKGLYAKARAGKIDEFTGVSSPYEVPLQPDLKLDSSALPLAEATRLLFEHLASTVFEVAQ
ncbi:MAG: adenylylsulfate kinase [Rhodocyclales bacterium]|nr:adenylylsulfate kinase [Rhodocyclales bacterium]